VSGVIETVSFNANGGEGTMKSESADVPTPLTLNSLTRAGYTFTHWNTLANGSGQSYANGANYSFSASVTLYAQWKQGKVPSHDVDFNANGGRGKMSSETDNTPTGLSAISFTRPGYTFKHWSTKANGSGVIYANGATYSFKSSITLFAQWKKVVKVKKPTFTVTFKANGGRGSMAAETHSAPATLSPTAFTRAGYAFTHWSTAANGSGNDYASGSTYPFSSSTALYAQWRKIKVVVPKPIVGTATVGPFALKSSTLTASLEAQITALANKVRTNHDTKVHLAGYGDKLSASQELDEALWAANVTLSQHRASAVYDYLSGRLSALGLGGVAISMSSNGTAKTSSVVGIVVATLS
jgi:uncharacterized repeat protein (TIGR02543 family)